MSAVKRVPSKAKETHRALVGLGFRLAGRSGGHPFYEHPDVDGRLKIAGTPRSAGLALKRTMCRARKMLRGAGVPCP